MILNLSTFYERNLLYIWFDLVRVPGNWNILITLGTGRFGNVLAYITKA
uniref:Uncharacterized protein n=1 Tax=Arundo donax TaxID=35708 RepID=A0A0A9C5Z0_ARUDO